MSEEFKPGDVVMLKSGGPQMTIERLTSDGDQWVCLWFEAKTKREGFFAPATLKKAG